MKRSLLAAALVLAGSLAGQAQTQNRFDDLIPRDKLAAPQQMSPEEQIKGLENTIGLLEQLSVMSDQKALQTKLECLKAIGEPKLCQCISQETPMTVNFVGYVAATSLSNEQLGYQALSPDDRKAIDTSRAARVKCIGNTVMK